MSEATDLIAQGLEVIRRDGWTGRAWRNDNGNVCAFGALDAALSHHEQWRTSPMFWKAVAILDDHIPADWQTPWERTEAKEVVDGTHSFTHADNILTDLAVTPSRVIAYNNSQTSQDIIEGWFEKAAADERI